MITELLSRMKKGTLTCITVASILAISPNLFAQKGKNAIQIGTAKTFVQHLLEEKSATARGYMMRIQTTESSLPLVINLHTSDGIGGGIVGVPTSSVFFDFINNKVEGKVILPSQEKAYNYYSDENGNMFVEEVDINKVVCINMYNTPMEPTAERAEKTQHVADPIPALESLPGATAVLYLDFDGQVVTSTKWNN